MGTAELHQGSNESPAPSPRPPSVSKEEESGKNEEITKDIDIVSSYLRWEPKPMRRLEECFQRRLGEFFKLRWEPKPMRRCGELCECRLEEFYEFRREPEPMRGWKVEPMRRWLFGIFGWYKKSPSRIDQHKKDKARRNKRKAITERVNVCGTKKMMHSKWKITLRKIRKLTRKEEANGNAEKEESFTEETSSTSMNKEDLDNSKKSVEVEKEINVKGTFSASMKNEDHEKSMKSAEVENEDNFKEKGTSTTSMNKEDCENNMKSVEVVKEDTFDEKGLSSTSMNKEGRKDRNQSKKSTEVENEDNVKVKGTSSTRMNKEGEEKLEYRRCIICLSADLCMVFFPCRHVVACEACSDRLKTCAVCRALIRGSVKVN